MVQSQYSTFIAQGFKGIVLKTENTINGKTGADRYLHQDYLDLKFSVDGKWTSLSSDDKVFVADVVSMDSSTPLVSRGSLGRASGSIFKLAQAYSMGEEELTELQTLIDTRQMDEAVAKFFQDTPKVIQAVHERNEALFLQMLSTGVALVEDSTNKGTSGVRLDAKVPSANKFGSTLPWSSASATPISDLKKLIDKAEADGRKITKFLMNRSDFNKLKKSDEAKEIHATTIGNFGTIRTMPTTMVFIEEFRDELGADIQIVERSVSYQKNGVTTTVMPWEDGRITGVTSNKLGSLVWAKLAELNAPVAGVAYQTANNFILASKFRENNPLRETTKSEARVCPVLNNVEGIYMLDSTLTTP